MKKESKSSDKRASLLASYQDLFTSNQGRKVLLDLMKNNHCLNTTFDENPYRAAFLEGQRYTVLRLFETLKVDIGEFLKQVEEVNKKGEGGLWD